MPHFATERGCGQFAWLQGLLFSKPKPRKGGQGTMGPLRRFFGDFLSAGGKKVTRRRQDKVAARQGVRERQRRGQSPSHGLHRDRVGPPLRPPIGWRNGVGRKNELRLLSPQAAKLYEVVLLDRKNREALVRLSPEHGEVHQKGVGHAQGDTGQHLQRRVAHQLLEVDVHNVLL